MTFITIIIETKRIEGTDSFKNITLLLYTYRRSGKCVCIICHATRYSFSATPVIRYSITVAKWKKTKAITRTKAPKFSKVP